MKTFDANPTGALSFLQQQAAHIEAEVYRMEYPQYKYTDLVPLDQSAPDWTKTVMFRAMDARGRLKKLGPNSTDVPTVDVGLSQGFHEVGTYALGYTFSLEELNYSLLNNVNLDAERATAVRDVVEGDLNRIYLLGDQDAGEGLYSSTQVPRVNAAGTIASLVADIPTNGAQPLITLFGNEYDKVYRTQTNTVHRPTVFALPTSVHQLLMRTLLSTDNASNVTVLQFLQMNFPDMTFIDDINLETAGNGGTTRMVTYKREMRVVKGHDVMPLMFLAPATADNLHFKVPAVVRTGGCEWRIPKAGSYLDNV